MSDLSEDYWCAGWLADLEYELWAAVSGGRTKFSAAEVAQLRYLSAKCGGWIVFHDAAPWRQYVPLTEWEREYADWRSRHR